MVLPEEAASWGAYVFQIVLQGLTNAPGLTLVILGTVLLIFLIIRKLDP